MTEQSPIRNSFRRTVLNGEQRKLLVEEKHPKVEHRPVPAEEGSHDAALGGAMIPRSEGRRNNHREGDRHRLTDETAIACHGGKTHAVDLINLSGGGAMIRAPFEPRLWDMIELRLGDGPGIECAVRWLRDGLVGLEFAHETRIDCDPETRARLLLAVIDRSFPDLEVTLDMPEAREEALPEETASDLGNRAETRHPLVWSGQVLYQFESNRVRLRNISIGGALVDVETAYPVGAEVMLDLGPAGQFDSVVSWCRGEQAGLRFKQPFNLDCLSKARPDLTPYRWRKPDFLRRDEDSTPWDDEWSRLSLGELQAKLEGFLKH